MRCGPNAKSGVDFCSTFGVQLLLLLLRVIDVPRNVRARAALFDVSWRAIATKKIEEAGGPSWRWWLNQRRCQHTALQKCVQLGGLVARGRFFCPLEQNGVT